MKKFLHTKRAAAAICAVALVVDQASKLAVNGFMESRGGEDLVLIPGFLSVIQSHNTGVAFGMFNGVPWLALGLQAAAVVVLAVVYLRTGLGGGAAGTVGAGLLFGGAVGNIIDRLRIGHVFDFILAHWENYYWPAFNAADIFIVAGAALFGIAVIRSGADG